MHAHYVDIFQFSPSVRIYQHLNSPYHNCNCRRFEAVVIGSVWLRIAVQAIAKRRSQNLGTESPTTKHTTCTTSSDQNRTRNNPEHKAGLSRLISASISLGILHRSRFFLPLSSAVNPRRITDSHAKKWYVHPLRLHQDPSGTEQLKEL